MSSQDPDIRQFLEIVPKLLGQHLGEGGAPASVADLRRALDESGVSDLAIDTADVPNTLEWLTATVSEVARVSPSLAFAVASRYAAQRALLGVGSTGSGSAGATLGTISPIGDSDDPPSWGEVLVPMLFEPDTTVLVDLGSNRGAVYGADEVVHSAEPVRRTGLRHAQLVAITVDGPARTELDPVVVGATVRDWTALTSAVSLGIAEAALHTAETYAADRRQFGAALSSFAGLRALLAEMRVQVAAAAALIARALEPDARPVHWAEASAAASRAAVDVAIEAIQVLGGYGYVEEYPVAGLLRDAVSVRARACSRRSSLATVAAERLGKV